ncbi:MAG TPA: type II secretion system protein [bacterium]|nr:type II secretion system protein [bacterium]
MKRFLQHRGFALIELMVVVAVLSLAAAFFVPRFLKHQIRTRQEECTANLRSFYEAQKVRREKAGSFATDMADLGWAPQGKGRYDYRLVASGKRSFVFQCSGNIDKDPTLDEASIDESGRITQISDDARK